MPEHQREMLSLVTARVRDVAVRAPFYVDGALDAAASIAELKAAAQRIEQMVIVQQRSGLRIERIAALVGELNRRLIARLWMLIAPPELVANSCLLVMGSEGRGEQILRTDQDNGLILRDGFDFAGLGLLAARFSAALAEFGYPPCPGQIMLTNPLWRQPLAGFRESIRGWLMDADPAGPMRLAIFCDAAAVAGDASLLAGARGQLDRLLADNDFYLARFAAAAEQFSEPAAWLAWLKQRRNEQPLNLKKRGIFPIVHGVRALALQYRVDELGTAARLARLVALGPVDEAMARELLEALHLLMSLRLAHQLRQLEAGEAPGNELRPSALAVPDREPLRKALAVAKQFRLWLRRHFRLDAL